ncbi:MAG TPA: SusC/RagA family TonB-linked outer membrane protein [Phnomibacter sp.]|nr:SusC/RagA family TonB-linked outer membrane protein [Phnomibacter sp.]
MKKTMQKLLFAWLMCCTALIAQAQQRTVTGKVADEQGAPVANASFLIKGTKTGGITDANGAFSISVDGNKVVIEFSAIGYETKAVSVGTSNSLAVVLAKSGAKDLEEVTVTALGIKKDTRKVGVSTQKVASQDLVKAAPPSIAEGLAGKVAGLNITVPNGVEGSSQKIQIRGNNVLLGNNQPLFVIDGVQMSDGRMGMTQSNGTGYDISQGTYTTPDLGGTIKDWGSPLNFINSEDIEDVNVLKGPTAAALYGARGANGVVLISTKKGAKRQGFGVEYTLNQRWTKAYLFQDYQHEYGYGGAIGLWSADDNQKLPKDANGNYRYPAEAPWSGAGINDKFTQFGPLPGGYNYWDMFSWPGAGLSWGARMDGRNIVWWDGKTRPYSPDMDANKSFFQTGHTSNHNLAFSTGGDIGSLRVAMNYTDNDAVIPNSGYDQTAVNMGGNLNISQKVKAEVSANYTKFNRLNSPAIGDNNSISKFLTYGFPMDYHPIEKDVYQKADGSKNMFDNATYPMSYPYGSYTNLWWNMYNNNTTMQRDQVMGAVKLTAEINPWLNLMGRTGVNYATNEFETKETPVDVAGLQGKYAYELNKDYTVTAEALATAHKEKIADVLSASFSVGASTWYNKFEGTSAKNNGPFADPFLYYLSNTTATVDRSWLPTYYRLESKINSVFGLLNLGYKNFLFLEATGRNDWSSTLPNNANSYFYPSANMSFVFTDAFKMNKNILDMGRVRLGYAGSANGTEPYQTTNVVGSGSFGGVVTRNLDPRLRPTDLVPQRSKSWEVGTQLAFFKSRLSVDFSYYKINSTNQILNAPLPTSSGFTSRTFNTGELENKGYEFIIRGTPVHNKNFNWDITLNAAHNSNKVIKLDEGVDKFYLGTIFGARTGVSMYVTEGEQYGSIYGLDYTYKDGQKVVRRIYDKSDPTKVVGTQYVTTADPVKIGNATPVLTGGIGNTLNYKNFSLYMLADFKWGGDIYSFDYASAMGEGKAPETLLERNGGGLPYTYPDGTTANHGVVLDGVFADGKKNTDVVHYMYKYAGQYAAWSNVDMPRSNAVFENSWFKCREVSLSYNFPSKMIQSSKVFQGLSLSLVGRDLFYFYKSLPDNLNPEGVSGVGNMQGMQWAALPGTRSFGFIVRAKF